MTMQNKARQWLSLVLLVALFCLTDRAVAQAPSKTKVPSALQNPLILQTDVREYDQLITAIRQAGLEKQRAQIRTLISVLRPDVLQAAQNVPSVRRARFYLQAATLLALARIGDPAALPLLQEVEPLLDPYFKKELLPVVIARIQVEHRRPNPRTTADWQEKVSHFLKLAEVSMDEVEIILEQYSHSCRQWPPDNILYAPRAIWALRQLAEMAADACASGIKDAFQVFKPITAHLEKDYALWVRIQIGQRPAKERIQWLVDQLVGKEIERMEDGYLMQALSDCGEQAVPVIRASLEMLVTSSPAKRVGSSLLLKVLAAIDAPSAVAVLEQFAAVPDEFIAQEARAYLQRQLSGERPTFVSWW